ncbi:hypothetical protein TYRP_017218 [Tyrophagus putrescentiae]|nr:hypothetical protein TYRP_017218 [Tyrophagus putrescentiae]
MEKRATTLISFTSSGGSSISSINLLGDGSNCGLFCLGLSGLAVAGKVALKKGNAGHQATNQSTASSGHLLLASPSEGVIEKEAQQGEVLLRHREVGEVSQSADTSATTTTITSLLLLTLDVHQLHQRHHLVLEKVPQRLQARLVALGADLLQGGQLLLDHLADGLRTEVLPAEEELRLAVGDDGHRVGEVDGGEEGGELGHLRVEVVQLRLVKALEGELKGPPEGGEGHGAAVVPGNHLRGPLSVMMVNCEGGSGVLFAGKRFIFLLLLFILEPSDSREKSAISHLAVLLDAVLLVLVLLLLFNFPLIIINIILFSLPSFGLGVLIQRRSKVVHQALDVLSSIAVLEQVLDEETKLVDLHQTSLRGGWFTLIVSLIRGLKAF